MGKRINIKITTAINVIILLSLFLIFLSTGEKAWPDLEEVTRILSIISIGLLAWYIFLIKKFKLKIYDFRIYFIVLNMIFIMGQIWICFFGKQEYLFWKLLLRANIAAVMNGGMIALLIQHGFVTGMFSGKEKTSTLNRTPVEYGSNLLWNTGLITFIVFFPLKIYYDVVYMAAAAATSGYLDSSQISVNGMIYCFGVVSLVGIFYMIESKKLSKNGVKILVAVISIYFIITMLGTGDRRFAIIALLCILLCYFHSYKIKLKASVIIPVLCIGYVALVFLNIISSTRKTTGIPSGAALLDAVINGMLSFDVIWDNFAEFGITLMCYVYTYQYFPALFPYRMGSQLLVNIVAVLPIGGILANWKEATGIQTAINNYVKQPLGGALGTDLYGNFGLFSFVVAVALGFLMKRLMDIRKVELSDYESAKYFSLMYIMINMVRAGFGEIIRLGFYCYFIPIIILLLLAQKNKQ